MKNHPLILSFIVLLFLISSCSETESTAEELPDINFNTDTIKSEYILAKYRDNNVISVIISRDSLMNEAVKINFSGSAPVIADSLLRTGRNIYSSKIYPFTYEFRDCEVIQTQIMKTIHPSSNWQGQTPGDKAVAFTFRNIK